jgi:TolB-like protein/Flp pilus assembly protein TadD
LDTVVSWFQWIGANESVLSGIAATIVIVGVLFTPIRRGLGALLRRAARASEPPAPTPSGGADPPLIRDRPSIAVLPFANLSGDPEHAFLADGLSEEIILGLSRVKQFFVIARNSSFTYKGRAVDAQQVSRELGVRYVLEGSVRKLGERVRVSAQLVDASNRRTAWAERFDRPVEQIVEVDDEVTEAIVAALQPALRRAEADLARRAAPEDLTVWARVNRAWVAVQSDLGSREASESAIRDCEEALRLDPDYALAHAVLAHARSLLARDGGGDAAQAEASIRRALQLSDDDPLIHHCHAALLGNLGRTADGVRAWERALALDPNNAAARAGLGIARIYLGQPDRALASIDQALRLSPRDPLTYHWLANRALACALLGRWDEALDAAEASVARTGSQVGYAVYAAALAQAGRVDQARAAYAELARRAPGLDPAGFRRLAERLSPARAGAHDLVRAIYRAAGQEVPADL